jgi:hypothetical protein
MQCRKSTERNIKILKGKKTQAERQKDTDGTKIKTESVQDSEHCKEINKNYPFSA